MNEEDLVKSAVCSLFLHPAGIHFSRLTMESTGIEQAGQNQAGQETHMNVRRGKASSRLTLARHYAKSCGKLEHH